MSDSTCRCSYEFKNKTNWNIYHSIIIPALYIADGYGTSFGQSEIGSTVEYM